MIKGPYKRNIEKINIKAKEDMSRSKSKSKEEALKKNEKKDKTEKKEEKTNNLVVNKKEVPPNKKMNPYFYFQREVREKITRENPGAMPKEIMTIIAHAWKALDEVAKKKYADLTAKAKAQPLKENEGGNDQKSGKRKRSMGKNESKLI